MTDDGRMMDPSLPFLFSLGKGWMVRPLAVTSMFDWSRCIMGLGRARHEA